MILNLLKVEDHVLFIKDLNALAKSWLCPKCEFFTRDKRIYYTHILGCDGVKVQERFDGGVYETQVSPCEELARLGLKMKKDDTREFAAFDF